MDDQDRVFNVVIAGRGGQGVLRASDILADSAFRAGWDVKKSELHGMSQRGGSVSSDVRFGREVLSPMVPAGEADYLVVLAPEERATNRHRLRAGGVLIEPAAIDPRALPLKRSLNVALLGVLSRHLPIPESAWIAALHHHLPEKYHAANQRAFALGRSGGGKGTSSES